MHSNPPLAIDANPLPEPPPRRDTYDHAKLTPRSSNEPGVTAPILPDDEDASADRVRRIGEGWRQRASSLSALDDERDAVRV